jgi:hypothetical protein
VMYDILTAAQNTHEWAAVLHHTAFKIPTDDELKLQAVHVRARAEEVILALNELIERIEKGEIGVKDFAK